MHDRLGPGTCGRSTAPAPVNCLSDQPPQASSSSTFCSEMREFQLFQAEKAKAPQQQLDRKDNVPTQHVHEYLSCVRVYARVYLYLGLLLTQHLVCYNE